MNRGLTASHIGIVHQVVMEQRIVMIGLQTQGRHQDLLGMFLEQVIAQQHQYRTDTLTAQ